jgi:asparagine synthase (glutamine-hydrolysing)
VVNGEFYDFETIRRDLEAAGHRFRTHSDSEIALHLYEDLRMDCLKRLRGEFAFIIWDERNGELFAARDRFGIKPLFYFQDGGKLCLASEAKALFAAGVPANWDRESAFQNLFLSVDQDRSLFKGIRQVPPGHYLVATRRSVRVHRYWDVDYPRSNRTDTQRSEADWIEQIRFQLSEAVRIRVRADVPVGCYLSGGVDSSAVLGTASASFPGKVAAFTVAFEGREFDESSSAERTAARAGADFHRVAVANAEFADLFSDAVWHGEMVHYNAHGVARYALSRAVQASGYKVVLAGEGADELFAGYDFSSAALASSGSDSPAAWVRLLGRLFRPKSSHERQISAVSPKLGNVCKLLGFPPALLRALAEKLTLLKSLLSEDFVQAFPHRDPYGEFMAQFDRRSTMSGREPVRQVLYLWMKSLFVNYVLAADRLDMAHAVEVRLPFLDHKLFELTRTIPASLLAKGSIRKGLLRDAARPFITDEVYRGLKQPFFAPPSTLQLQNPMYQLIQDVLRSESLADIPFFDRRSVVALLDRLPAMDQNGRASMDPLLFMMTSLCILQKRYGLGVSG